MKVCSRGLWGFLLRPSLSPTTIGVLSAEGDRHCPQTQGTRISGCLHEWGDGEQGYEVLPDPGLRAPVITPKALYRSIASQFPGPTN